MVQHLSMFHDGSDVALVVVSEAEDDDTFSLALGHYFHLVVLVSCRLCVFLCLEFGRCHDFDCLDDSSWERDCFFPLRCDGVQGKESEEQSFRFAPNIDRYDIFVFRKFISSGI